MNVRLAQTVRGLATAFRDRNLRHLQAAWSLAWVADWAYFVGLGIYAYERGGPVAVGLAGLIRVAPAAAIAPFASLLGDRYRRLRILFVNQLVWTVALTATALAFFLHAHAAVVYALAAVTGVCSTVIRPTLAALLPWLAETPEQLITANAGLTIIESLGTLIGPLLGGVVVAAFQPGAVFTICAAASALASLAFALTHAEGEDVRRDEVRGGLVREAVAGFGLLVRDRDVGLAVLLGGAQAFVRGALNVLIVVAALGRLHMGSSGVGILTAAIGAGGLVGSLLAVNLVGRRLALPTAEVRRFRSVPMVHSLAVAASEYLARNAEEVEVHAGGVLISEGERGDRFYVVSRGNFDVSRSGRPLSTQGAGGFFGEMALLRDIPRQATVKATEDSSVFAFRGRDFIAAVTGHCLSDRTAQELVEARLSENVQMDQTAGSEAEA